MRDFTTTKLGAFEGELRADGLDDVESVVKQAEEAARRGRWVAGYLSYEAAPAFDPGLVVRARSGDPSGRVSLAWFGVFRDATTTPLRLPRRRHADGRTAWTPLIQEEDYVKKICSILDEIEVGTAYQVNLTNMLVSDASVDPELLYRRLLIAQQPAYGSLIQHDDVAIASASPELFIDWDGELLRSRPMKGTSRRGRFCAEDEARAAALVSSPKELAENVMIVDLIRNDMGRVAEIGTVKATELRSLEAYPNVWQLVSEVQCRTRDGVSLVEIFRAMFPCGSVTGAPKQSAMEIIERLEVAERGVYCGAVGLLSPTVGGLHARFSVAIRTAAIAGSTAKFGSGGGVVADSDPEKEHQEMALKAEMLGAPQRPFRLLETFGYGGDDSVGTIRRHLDRLRTSAIFLGFKYPVDLEERVIATLVNKGDHLRIRLMLSRGGEVDLQSEEAPSARTTPVRLAIDDEPVCSESMMLFHKTTLRDMYTRRRRKFPLADDVVMINEKGECTETTIANIAARRGGAWFTPPLASGCLPGIGRARLIEEGVLMEADLRPEDLFAADELAVVNSLRGWQVATLWRGEDPERGGSATVSVGQRTRL
ncbi:MAG TPA: chorismate-binding protein [Acidimicrobiales bacterium]|nr:chorismate-binding protein [Acidimicrobiales bacterium]